MPILFTTLPLLGIEVIENKYIEIATILIAIIVGGYAIMKGYFIYHHNKNIVIIFIVGLVVVVVANYVNSETVEAVLKIVGAVCIIIAHIKNKKASKHCITCKHI